MRELECVLMKLSELLLRNWLGKPIKAFRIVDKGNFKKLWFGTIHHINVCELRISYLIHFLLKFVG